MSIDACIDILRQSDPDRLAALLTAPPATRPRLISLYALAASLARAPSASTNPMLAEIRLQWWIDQIDRLPQSGTMHPVLGAVADHWGIEGRDLALLGEGQRAACDDAPFADTGEVLAWVDATSGTLAWIGAQVLGAPRRAEAPVRAQGRALGVAALLRGDGPRDHDPRLDAELREAGRAAAREASAATLDRRLGAVLHAGPALREALRSAHPRPVSEFSRRWSLLGLALVGSWKIKLPR